MVALRRVADTFGGIPKLADKTKLNPTTLYRTLSRKRNPEIRSMTAVLKWRFRMGSGICLVQSRGWAAKAAEGLPPQPSVSERHLMRDADARLTQWSITGCFRGL
jgi:hypothetical protein